MKKIFLLIVFVSSIFYSQNNKEKAIEKAKEAIILIDKKDYQKGINLLQECEKLDPKNFNYPYEIAYAYYVQKKYKKAISIAEKIEKYDNVNQQLYQLWGNATDLIGKPEKAIEIYDRGIKKFKKNGALYLEKGIIYEASEKYTKAIENYQKGIKSEPNYPSNYYRISKLFLQSNNPLYGLIYGEIFLNIERTTKRSLEMSQLLYNGYQRAVVFEEENVIEIHFCKAVINAEKFHKTKKPPFCITFVKFFALSTIDIKEFNLDNLSKMRSQFLKLYFEEKQRSPNLLLNYQRLMKDEKIFNAYNHYLFQMGDIESFKNWKSKNQEKYNKFVDWYTNSKNNLKFNKTNVFDYKN